MSELIPNRVNAEVRPEELEVREDRQYWNRVIGAVEMIDEASRILVEQGGDFGRVDTMETLEGLRDEDGEDALMLLFNYVNMLSSEEGQPSELDDVVEFLAEEGFLE